jgi:hypothetical protein
LLRCIFTISTLNKDDVVFRGSPRPSQLAWFIFSSLRDERPGEEIGETKYCEEMRRNVVTKYTPCFIKVSTS